MKHIFGVILLLCTPLSVQANDKLADLTAQLAAVTAVAFKESSQQMAVKVNLSGKQRMLTQKIMKEALFVNLDIQGEENKKSLKASADLFEKTLMGLKKGDEALGLTKTNRKDALEQLTIVEGLWKKFKRHVDSFLNDSNKEALEALANENLPLLHEMNKAVSYYEALGSLESSDDDWDELSVVINLSGKQRMLTQKMSKEALLIASKMDIEANKKNLEKTIALFAKTLNGLEKGDDELALVATLDTSILKQLAVVKAHWKSFKPLIEATVTAPTLLDKLAEENLSLLNEMNKTVNMYEAQAK